MRASRFASAAGLVAMAVGLAGCENAGASTVTPEPAAPRPIEAEPGDGAEPGDPAEPDPGRIATPKPDGDDHQRPAPVAAGEACGNGVSCAEGLGCSGLDYDAPGTCIAEADASSRCAARNGEWGKWGMLGARYCMPLISDGGTSCNDSAQCKGNCIAQPGATSGECQKYETQFGCYSILKAGQPNGALCVD